MTFMAKFRHVAHLAQLSDKKLPLSTYLKLIKSEIICMVPLTVFT